MILDHDRLRAAGAAAGLAAGRRAGQPGDAGGRRGPPGLRRRRHLGETWPGIARPRRDAGPAGRLGAARDAPHRGLKSARRDRRAASCAGTGWRASATASATPTRGPARAAIPGSGTGTPASRRSSGGASTRPASRAELESLLAAQRPDGFIGHTIFWDRPVSLSRLPFYNVASRRAFQTETIQPPLLAWAWRIAVGDPAAEPRIAAQADWLAAQPRPRGRRPALDRPARRVGARRLAQVRPGLGTAGERADRLPLPGAAQPPARLRRAAGARARRAGPLRDAGQHDVVALAAGAGTAVGDPGAGRAALGRAARALPRRGAARRSAPAMSSPGPPSPPSPCPTCRRRSAGGWSRSTC